MTDQPKNFDEENVKAALERTTQDGPGTADLASLPASDFESFAEADVEQESK